MIESETQRLRAALEAREKVVRLYAVLSRVNEAIVRCRVEQDLHQAVCRILVEDGGYALAWIGQPRGDRVVPTVAIGASADYVREISVAIDGEFGKGPTGTSIREGRAVVNEDFLANAQMGPWRDRAAQHGFRSSAAFPLRRNGAVVASLTLYSREPSAFDAEHMTLLEALAADLSYAHDAIEDERLRNLAQESLARSEALLRDATKRKNDLLAMLSHELRNPLAPIKNSLHVLECTVPGCPQAQRAQEVIRRQVSLLTRLVDDLLDITRVNRGKLRIDRVRVDLLEIVRHTADDLRPMFASARIRFEVALGSGPLWLHGDAVRLAQIVGNLLTNAAKYTPAGGNVVLTAVEAPTGVAVLRVRDTGVGIAGDLLGRVFEPFLQAEDTLGRSRGGLGLGLALVKGLVEAHGGSVEAHSEGVGRGGEFVVSLPMGGEPTPTVAVDDGEGARSHVRPLRVLVIDDNIDAAVSMQDTLAVEGHEVEVAYNGNDGIEKARLFRPHVVICDIEMSGMHGYDVAAAFRSDDDLRSVFLVAHSGYVRPEDAERANAAGFDAHLRKPASIAEIEQVLARSNAAGEVLPRQVGSAVDERGCAKPCVGADQPAGEAWQAPPMDTLASLRRQLRQKAHDVSTPLATLSLSLQTALTRLQRGEPVREETVRKALRQVETIADLMKDLVLAIRG